MITEVKPINLSQTRYIFKGIVLYSKVMFLYFYLFIFQTIYFILTLFEFSFPKLNSTNKQINNRYSKQTLLMYFKIKLLFKQSRIKKQDSIKCNWVHVVVIFEDSK